MSQFYIESLADFEAAIVILDRNQISYSINDERLICVAEKDVCEILEAFDKEDIYYLEAC